MCGVGVDVFQRSIAIKKVSSRLALELRNIGVNSPGNVVWFKEHNVIGEARVIGAGPLTNSIERRNGIRLGSLSFIPLETPPVHDRRIDQTWFFPDMHRLGLGAESKQFHAPNEPAMKIISWVATLMHPLTPILDNSLAKAAAKLRVDDREF